MAIQILYPIADLPHSGFWANQAGNRSVLYPSIDEGVSTANDTDYIELHTPQAVFDSSSTTRLTFRLDGCTLRPESIKFRARAKKNPFSAQQVYLWRTFIYDSGMRQLSAGGSVEIPDGTFRNLEGSLDDFDSTANYHPEVFPTYDVGVLYLQTYMNAPGASPELSGIQISAIEVEISGEPWHYDNVNLFVPGAVDFCDNQNLYPSGKYNTPSWRVRGNYDFEDNFDLGFWPVNEGSGNVIYDLTGTRSGVYTNGNANGRWVDWYKQGTIAVGGQQQDQSKYDYGLQLGPGYITFDHDVLAPTGDFTLYFRAAPSGITADNPPQFTEYTPVFFRESGTSNLRDYATEFAARDFCASVYQNSNGQVFQTCTNSGNLPADPWPQAYVVTYGPDNRLRVYTDYGRFSSIQVVGSSNPVDRFVSTSGITYLGAFIDGLGNIRTANLFMYEFGMASRAFTQVEADEVLSSIYEPSYYIHEDPDTVLPAPSGGADTTYIEWNRLHATTGSGSDSFTCVLRPWFGNNVYQLDGPYQTELFGDVELNSPDSIRLKMWVENLSNVELKLRPNIRLATGNNPLWTAHELSVPSGLHYVNMSGFFTGEEYPILISEMDRDRPTTFQMSVAAQGGADFSHNFRIYSAKFDFDAWCVPATGTGILDLYVSGSPPNESLDLYILGGERSSGNLDLYIQGIGSVNDLDLFTHGIAYHSGTIDLFVESKLEASSQIPLYVRGILEDNADMPLFLKTADVQDSSGNFDLYIWSTDNSGLFTYTSFYLKADEETGTPDEEINLVIAGHGAFDLTSNINLFIKTDGNDDGSLNINDNIELFIKNGYVQQTGTFNLFMNAPSGTDGAVPISGTMNLFINRLYDSIANQMDLFINGPSGINEELTLYLNAQPSATGLLDAYIKGIGTTNSNTTTYIHGF